MWNLNIPNIFIYFLLLLHHSSSVTGQVVGVVSHEASAGYTLEGEDEPGSNENYKQQGMNEVSMLRLTK